MSSAATGAAQMFFQCAETTADVRALAKFATEVRVSVGAAAKSATPQTAMLAQVARQIADIIPAVMDKLVQNTLLPEELGRVRLSVAVSETRVIVSILAEWAETLDSMRRNIDQVQRDFQTLGFGTADDLGTINIQTEVLDIKL